MVTSYVHGAGWTYPQYLQAKSFSDSIRWEMRDIGFQIGGSLNALNHSGLRIEGALNRLDQNMQTGFVALSFDLKDVQATLSDMSAKFDYGFAELSTQLGSIRDTLEELLRLAKNPEQTWAYEQYEIARDAFGRGLFAESLQFVSRAIEGHQSHTGYPLEHRFHHFRGVLRLGDHRNQNGEIVDLKLAEADFINAARCANVTHPTDAARALCMGGFAAYAQGNAAGAMQLTDNAVRFHPRLPEANFQLAKISLHLGKAEEGLSWLVKAVQLDPLYAVKCFSDLDFTRYESQIIGVIKWLRDQRQKQSHDKALRSTSLLTQVRSQVSSLDVTARGLSDDWADNHLNTSTLTNRIDAHTMVIEQLSKQSRGQLPYLDAVSIEARLDAESFETSKLIVSTRSRVSKAALQFESVWKETWESSPEQTNSHQEKVVEKQKSKTNFGGATGEQLIEAEAAEARSGVRQIGNLIALLAIGAGWLMGYLTFFAAWHSTWIAVLAVELVARLYGWRTRRTIKKVQNSERNEAKGRDDEEHQLRLAEWKSKRERAFRLREEVQHFIKALDSLAAI